jgi:hypothetical protein
MRILERILAITLLLSAMNFFVGVLYGKDLTENTMSALSTGELHPGVTAINILLYAVAGFFMVLRYRRFWAAMQHAWPLLALVLVCFLSSAWSIDPGLTFRRSIFLLGSTLFGIYLGGRYSIVSVSRLLLIRKLRLTVTLGAYAEGHPHEHINVA